MTTTLITASLLDRARPEAEAFATPAVSCTPMSPATHATSITSAHTTNRWLGGNDVQGTGFGKYATKRIHPGRLGVVT